MDDTLKCILLWLYITVAVMLCLGILWIASAATFWMFPKMVDPPTWSIMLGLAGRIGIVSLVSAAWSAVSVIGWRRLIGDMEKWMGKVDS